MATPNKVVVVLFGDVRVMELSAGGVPELVEAWTDQAKMHLSAGTQQWIQAKGWRWVEPPALSAQEKRVFNQHLTLYGRLVDALYTQAAPTAEPLWQSRAKAFRYPLGHGLDFIRDKTGADTALIVYGYDQISTKGRKATMAVSAFLGAFSGSYILPGATAISVGMVDLQRGELLWFGSEAERGCCDLREAQDVEKMLTAMFQNYPRTRVKP